MKNHLVLFTIVLLLGLSSCGIANRTLSQEMQTDSRTERYDSSMLEKELHSIIRATIDEILSREYTQDVTIDRKVWSPPDTAGNQYIVQEETVKSVTVAKETKKNAETLSEVVSEQTDSTSVSASIEDLVVDTTTEITEKDGLPWWQKTLMVIGAVVLLYIIIRIALKFI